VEFTNKTKGDLFMSSSTGDTSSKMPWFRSFNAKMKTETKRKYAEDKVRKQESEPKKSKKPEVTPS